MVDNRDSRKHSRYERISSNMVKRYLSFFTQQVEDNISEVLPDNTALTFDGQSVTEAHFVVITVLFPINNLQKFSTSRLVPSLHRKRRGGTQMNISASLSSFLVCLGGV